MNFITIHLTRFIKNYCQTILEIIEDKPKFALPIFIYNLLIIILYCQIAGYFFSSFEVKPIKESIALLVCRLNEVSPGTFLLYMKGNDQLTIVIFWLMNIILLSILIYIGVLSYYKENLQGIGNAQISVKFKPNSQLLINQGSRMQMVSKLNINNRENNSGKNIKTNQIIQKSLTKTVNEALNLFFTLYWWIFFTPYIEINSGVFVCGGNSFLVKYREIKSESQECLEAKPIWQRLVPIIGLMMANSIGLIIIMFFRNYYFEERNYFKRRYKQILLFLLILRFIDTFMYYLNLDIVVPLKHVIADAIGFLSLYDIFKNYPIRQHCIQKFYTVATVFFYWSVIVLHIFIFTDELPEDQIGFLFVLVGSILGGAFLSIQKFQYEKKMRLCDDIKCLKGHYDDLDIYLEEIMILLHQGSKNDQEAVFKLREVLIYHQYMCQNADCYSKRAIFFDEHKIINEQEVIKFIYEIFSHVIKNHSELQRADQHNNFEHLSLKYMSFLTKYVNNPFQSYFQLKLLVSITNSSRFGSNRYKEGSSFYFQGISQIYSKQIDSLMEKKLQERSNWPDNSLNIEQLANMESTKNKFLPKISLFLKHKVEFWEQLLRIQDRDINQLLEQGMALSDEGLTLHQDFISDVGNFNLQYSQSIIYYKLESIFHSAVLSMLLESCNFESCIIDLLKKDLSHNQNCASNINIINRSMISLKLSFVKDRGLILDKQVNAIADFFAVSRETVKNSTKLYIKDFMPKFIKNLHDQLMFNFVQRGYSVTLKQTHKTYASDGAGFIFPIRIYSNQNFTCLEDYILYGSLVKEKQDQFNQSQDLLGQKTILFDQSGKIIGMTKQIYNQIFLQGIEIIRKLFKEEDESFLFQQFSDLQISIILSNIYEQSYIYYFMPRILIILQEFKKNIKLDINTIHQLLTDNQLAHFILPLNLFQIIKLFIKNQSSNLKKANDSKYIQQNTNFSHTNIVVERGQIMGGRGGAEGENQQQQQSKYNSNHNASNQYKKEVSLLTKEKSNAIKYDDNQANKWINKDSIEHENLDRIQDILEKNQQSNYPSLQFILKETLLDDNVVNQIIQFINENKTLWMQESRIKVDFILKFDLFYTNILYGENFQNNFIYFDLKVNDIQIDERVINQSQAKLMKQARINQINNTTTPTNQTQGNISSLIQRYLRQTKKNLFKNALKKRKNFNSPIEQSISQMLFPAATTSNGINITQSNKKQKDIHYAQGTLQKSISAATLFSNNSLQTEQPMLIFQQQQQNKVQNECFPEKSNQKEINEELKQQPVNQQYQKDELSPHEFHMIKSNSFNSEVQILSPNMHAEFQSVANLQEIEGDKQVESPSDSSDENKSLEFKQDDILQQNISYDNLFEGQQINNFQSFIYNDFDEGSETDVLIVDQQKQKKNEEEIQIINQKTAAATTITTDDGDNTFKFVVSQKEQLKKNKNSSKKHALTFIQGIQQLQQNSFPSIINNQNLEIYEASIERQYRKDIPENLKLFKIQEIIEDPSNNNDLNTKKCQINQLEITKSKQKRNIMNHAHTVHAIQKTQNISVLLNQKSQVISNSQQQMQVNITISKMKASISSQQNMNQSIDVQLKNKLIFSTKELQFQTGIQQLLLAFSMFFIILVLIFLIFLASKFADLQFVINFTQHPSLMTTYYSKVMIGLLGIFENRFKLLPNNSSLQDQVLFEGYIQEAKKNYLEMHLKTQEHFLDIMIIDNQILNVDVFSFDQHQQLQIKNFEFQMMQLQEVASKNLLSLNDQQAFRDGLSFFLANAVTEYKLTFQLIQDFDQLQNNFHSDFIFKYIIFTVCAFSVLVSVNVLLMPQIKCFLIYKKKIFSIICKLFESEAYLEIKRLQTFSELLNDSGSSYLRQDFNWVMTAQMNELQMGKFDEPRRRDKVKESIHTGEYSISQQISQNKVKKKNSVKNSKMYLSKKVDNNFQLGIQQVVIFNGLLTFVCSLYFIIILVINIVNYQNIQPLLQLNMQAYKINHALNAIVSTSEILAFYNEIKLHYPILSQHMESKQNLRQILNKAKFNLDSFLKEYPQLLKDVEQLNEEYYTDINQLLTQDICSQINSCIPENAEKLKGGIVSLITNYNKMLIAYNDSFFSDDADNDNNKRLSYFNSKEHQILILQAQLTANQILIKFIEKIENINVNQINSVVDISQIFCLLIGCILFLIILFAINLFVVYMIRQIKLINFMLSFMPFEKWKDEVIIHLLKQIINC